MTDLDRLVLLRDLARRDPRAARQLLVADAAKFAPERLATIAAAPDSDLADLFGDRPDKAA